MKKQEYKASAEGGKQALYAQKYVLLQEKLVENYTRGCKYLCIAKVVSAVLFLIFTVAGVCISGKTGAYMLWLVLWIVLIFLNVAVFMTADYCKYQMQTRVIPFLENDECTAFFENDILSDRADESKEEAE